MKNSSLKSVGGAGHSLRQRNSREGVDSGSGLAQISLLGQVGTSDSGCSIPASVGTDDSVDEGGSELPSFLREGELRFIFFGGKGGVGKTTAAAASALYLARQRPDRRMLIVSTDPAHSLGDSLAQHIGDQVVPVRGVNNLYALELDAPRLLREFKSESDPIIAKIVDRGTYLDEEDIEDFLLLSLPGMDEMMAIIEIMDLAKSREYELVVVDTAPTGHTLRMLALPGEMRKWLKAMNLMMDKHRFIVMTLVGQYSSGEVDRWLVKMEKDLKRVDRLLKDTRATEFVAVTIPEEMAIYEMGRLVTSLRKMRIPIKNVIVNRVVSHDGHCPSCQQRRTEQAKPLREMEERFADLRRLPVPLLPYQVQGLDRLTEYGQLLAGVKKDRAEDWRGGLEHDSLKNMPQPLGLSVSSSRFLLFGGKGGVGKTTTAVATALYLASRFPGKRVLVFSTDPAHSVSDSLGQEVGDQITNIDGYPNLYAQEIDAQALLEEFKDEYRGVIDQVFDSFMGGRTSRVAFDRPIMDQLLDLAPPGLDEMMALMEIMELVEAQEYDIFILDTAPTGHLLRFLETPDLAREWFMTLARVLLKYRRIVSVVELNELVIKLMKQVRSVREQLVDSVETEFITVTIPEAMAVAETERLLQSLTGLGIASRQVLINMVTPPSDCPFCSAKSGEEEKYIQQFMAQYPEHRIAQTPRLPHPIRGIEELVQFGEVLYRDGGGAKR